MKENIRKEASYYYRPGFLEPDNYSNPLAQFGDKVTNADERFDRDVVSDQKREKERRMANQEAARLRRKQAKIEMERNLWEKYDKEYNKQQEKYDKVRNGELSNVGFGSRSNEGSVAYNPITLATRDSLDGAMFEVTKTRLLF